MIVFVLYCIIIACTDRTACANIAIDHLCGADINIAERVMCDYEMSGIYEAQTVYEHIERITFTHVNTTRR